MKKFLLLFAITAIFGGFIGAKAQSLQLLKPVKLKKWGIPAANYSGISYMGNNRYAVISDKQDSDGWYEFEIKLNEETAKVEDVRAVAFHKNDNNARDAEDICFVKSTGRIYIAAEDDQRIIEYDTLENRTGRELAVPEALGKEHIYPNYGFESLTYTDGTALFWTCTENSLKSDAAVSSFENRNPATIRLQSFNMDLKPFTQYLYVTDAPQLKKQPKILAFGVSALTGLEDNSLLVLEREFFVAKKYIGSWVVNKIYRIKPSEAHPLPSEQKINGFSDHYAMPKMLLAEWKTKLNLTKRNIANYEGMCLGPKLKDGRQTILLISDSQGGYGNSLFHLKDYLRVGILNQ